MPEPQGVIIQSHVIFVDFHNVEIIHCGVSYVSEILVIPKPSVYFSLTQSKSDFPCGSSRTERCQKQTSKDMED
jgi:hypothetical protein